LKKKKFLDARQEAVVEPLAGGKSGLQVSLTTLKISEWTLIKFFGQITIFV